MKKDNVGRTKRSNYVNNQGKEDAYINDDSPESSKQETSQQASTTMSGSDMIIQSKSGAKYVIPEYLSPNVAETVEAAGVVLKYEQGKAVSLIGRGAFGKVYVATKSKC